MRYRYTQDQLQINLYYYGVDLGAEINADAGVNPGVKVDTGVGAGFIIRLII